MSPRNQWDQWYQWDRHATNGISGINGIIGTNGVSANSGLAVRAKGMNHASITATLCPGSTPIVIRVKLSGQGDISC